MKINRLLHPAALLLMALAAACSGGADSDEAAAAAAQGQAMPVTVATPLVQEVVDWDDYVGRFEAVQSVEVRPRVSGYLQGVHFTDGQYVRRGQLLFTVDPRQAEAQRDQARAQLARAEAALANARTELARSRTLADSRAASQEEVEARQAAVRAGEADVAAGRAALRAAELTLGFTRVTAPISGRISQRVVDVGNSVAADQTVLTTIVSTNPLHFAFDGSEALLLKYQREGGGITGSPVRIRLQDESDYAHRGTLDFIDSSINVGAGTIRARATVPNPDGFLRPGMFGHLQLAAGAPYQAMLVPDTAVVTDGPRRVLYIVDGEGMVSARPVELGPLVGNLRVIRAGLRPDERLVISGLQRARPGAPVQPQEGRIEMGEGAAAPPADAARPAAVASPAGQ